MGQAILFSFILIGIRFKASCGRRSPEMGIPRFSTNGLTSLVLKDKGRSCQHIVGAPLSFLFSRRYG